MLRQNKELTGKCNSSDLLVFEASADVGVAAGEPRLAELGALVVGGPVPERGPKGSPPLVQCKSVEGIVHIGVHIQTSKSPLLQG